MRRRKRERHHKWQTDWEVEMRREMRDGLKWGETFEDQQVNHSFDNCVGFSLWCLVMMLVWCACLLHPLQSGTHYNQVFKAGRNLRLINALCWVCVYMYPSFFACVAATVMFYMWKSNVTYRGLMCAFGILQRVFQLWSLWMISHSHTGLCVWVCAFWEFLWHIYT